MRLIHDEKRLTNKEEADRLSAFSDSRCVHGTEVCSAAGNDERRARLCVVRAPSSTTDGSVMVRTTRVGVCRDGRELRDTCNMRDTVCQRRDACFKTATHITQKGSLDKEPEFKCKQFISKCTTWCVGLCTRVYGSPHFHLQRGIKLTS